MKKDKDLIELLSSVLRKLDMFLETKLAQNTGFYMTVDEYREMMRTGKLPDRYYQDDAPHR